MPVVPAAQETEAGRSPHSKTCLNNKQRMEADNQFSIQMKSRNMKFIKDGEMMLIEVVSSLPNQRCEGQLEKL